MSLSLFLTLSLLPQALPSIRGVQVSKSNVTTASYTWSVTFTQDWPSISNTTVLLQDTGVVPLPGATYLSQVPIG